MSNPMERPNGVSREHAGTLANVPGQAAASRLLAFIAPALIVILSSAHGIAIWFGLGGLAGLTNGWTLWRFDHPLYYHSALVTRSFLKNSWTTAGYDPFFMAGYAKRPSFPRRQRFLSSSLRSPEEINPRWHTRSTYSSRPRRFPGCWRWLAQSGECRPAEPHSPLRWLLFISGQTFQLVTSPWG